MEGKRFIHSLKLQNFLSFGSEGEEIELQPLNVLIGANASGKSNLIEAFGILKALPTDVLAPIRRGGGVSEFLWKGSDDIPTAKIETVVEYRTNMLLRYSLGFTAVEQRLKINTEAVKNQYLHSYLEREKSEVYYHSNGFDISLKTQQEIGDRAQKILDPVGSSILSQIKEPISYPEITYLGNQFSNICLYQDWYVGGNSKARLPQKIDLPERPLLENGSNLCIFLNKMQEQIGSKTIIEYLNKLYDSAEEVIIKVDGSMVQMYVRETELTQPIPADKLSSGTLQYLFLVALLLDPTPPPLICIEQVELGLHPDMMSTIADLLIEASQRTQLIVTTYSEAVISSLPPESVLVCERDYKGTYLRRLDPNRLKKWLEEYSLGHIWSMGEIGGTRW